SGTSAPQLSHTECLPFDIAPDCDGTARSASTMRPPRSRGLLGNDTSAPQPMHIWTPAPACGPPKPYSTSSPQRGQLRCWWIFPSSIFLTLRSVRAALRACGAPLRGACVCAPPRRRVPAFGAPACSPLGDGAGGEAGDG